MAPNKSLAAEIEAVLGKRLHVSLTPAAGGPSAKIVGIPEAAAKIAALQSRAFEDGARLTGLLADAQPTVSRQGDLIMLDCPDGTITDEVYEALEAACYGKALPLQPEGERNA